jgi:hypothetical protein
MFLKADLQRSTAESKAATATRRSTVDLKRFCGPTPVGFPLLSLMVVSLCFSLRYAAQSAVHCPSKGNSFDPQRIATGRNRT